MSNLQKKEDENQQHILKCEKLNEETENTPEYEKIFQNDVSNQLKIAKIFKRNLEKRNILMEIN